MPLELERALACRFGAPDLAIGIEGDVLPDLARVAAAPVGAPDEALRQLTVARS